MQPRDDLPGDPASSWAAACLQLPGGLQQLITALRAVAQDDATQRGLAAFAATYPEFLAATAPLTTTGEVDAIRMDNRRGAFISGGLVAGSVVGTIDNRQGTFIEWGAGPAAPIDPASLAAAQARLLAMPTTYLPPIAPLRPGSRMALDHNRQFVGREPELLALAQLLKDGATAVITPKTTAATGLGGIGKTQLAVEFVHHFGQFFETVHWLNMADAASVAAEIAQCGGVGAMGLWPNTASLSLQEQVDLVKAVWNMPLPRLLVFDNCEEETVLHAHAPLATSGCVVLVTSRRAAWDVQLRVQRLALSTLTSAYSVALLRSYHLTPKIPDVDLERLANELGHLPLALHLAGSFLHEFEADMSVADYLAELRAAERLDIELLEGEGISATGHDQSVYRTFRLSYDHLNPAQATDALALKLLARAAYFAPGELLPRDLLKATLATADERPAARHVTKALKRLLDLGLDRSRRCGAAAHPPSCRQLCPLGERG